MQCRRSRSTLMGGKTIIRNYNEKNLFFTKFFIRKNFFEEHGGVSKCIHPLFYAQSPNFLKPGLCYFLKFLYL